MTLSISVLIPAKNEESNIAACLKSVSWANEIWVIDSHSTDRTVEIASQYTDKIIQFNYSGSYPKKKNWALENIQFANEWVLILDCDERVTPELFNEINRVITCKGGGGESGSIDGYYINRRLIFLGKWIKHCGWYPSWNLRLFKHKLGRYEKLDVDNVENTGDVEVHEHIILKGKTDYLKNDILHEDFKSVYHFIDRHNRYSNWDAQVYNNMANGKVGSNVIRASLFGSPIERKRYIKLKWAKAPFRPLLRFAWMYFIKRGFLDGKPGLIFCTLMTMHEAVISAKLFELVLRQRRRN